MISLLLYHYIRYREKEAESDGKGGLASAPSTLVSGDSLADAVGLDLTFKPQMGEMASLALPSNLPLDFLAGFLRKLIYVAYYYEYSLMVRRYSILWDGASFHRPIKSN